MRVLITGGAGFVGSHVVEHLLRETDWELISLDRLDTSGNLNRLADMDVWDDRKTRVRVVWHDLKAAISSQLARQIGDVDVILHLAASSHVDRSIDDPMSFVMDNVVGTCNLLEYARRLSSLQALYYQSTDEVYGPAPSGEFYKEWDRHKPGNPYSATKSAADSLCLAYHNTYRLPVLIGNAMNLIGQRQHVEKFVPKVIRSVMSGDVIPIHADPTCTIPGSRSYLHARNLADAILFILRHGTLGDRYNIVGEREVDNLMMAQMIADIIGKPLHYELVSWHESRPGHDLRYGLDGSKMASMGWKPPVSFERSLTDTVIWTLSHPEWLG